MDFHDTSQAYIACLQVENAELRTRLQQLDEVCRRIQQSIINKPLDEHGNSDRKTWLDGVVVTAKTALAEVGYPMFTRRYMEAWSKEKPGEVEDIDIPQFVRQKS